MKQSGLIVVLFLVASVTLQAQLGSQSVFNFLNLPVSPRLTALGGHLITVSDGDANLAFVNPASLQSSTHQFLSFNHSFLVAGMQAGYASYAHHFSGPDLSTHIGISYANYGEMEWTDEYFNSLGTFNAGEYALVMGASKKVADRLSLGMNAKLIQSRLAFYQSGGVAVDLAALYSDTSSKFTATLVFKNIGTQFSPYDEEGMSEPLPFEIQAGISKRLRYLPLRFSVIYRYLDRWNVLYEDPNAESGILQLDGTVQERSASSIWLDNFFRHFVFNAELLLGKQQNFILRTGYNHLMRKELAVNNYGSLSGFSFGFGMKVRRFRVDYGRGVYHLAGGSHHFSISTLLSSF